VAVDFITNMLTTMLRVNPTVATLLTTKDFNRAVRVLVSPESALPEDMQTIATRVFGLQEGVAKFFVDTATDPIFLASMMIAKRNPPRAFTADKVPVRFEELRRRISGLSLVFRPYHSHLAGTKLPKMHTLVSQRITRFLYGNTRVPGDLSMGFEGKRMRLFNTLSSQEKEILGRWVQDPSFSLTPKLQATANAWRSEIMDPIWEMISKKWGVRGTKLTQIGQAGYIHKYLPWMIQKGDHLTLNPKQMAVALRHKTRSREMLQLLNRPGVDMTDVGKWVWREGDNVVLDMKGFQSWLNNGGSTVFNPSLMSRKSITTPENLVWDIDQITYEYIRRASKTFAAAQPISKYEAALVHGAGLIETPPAALGVLSKQIATQKQRLAALRSELSRARQGAPIATVRAVERRAISAAGKLRTLNSEYSTIAERSAHTAPLQNQMIVEAQKVLDEPRWQPLRNHLMSPDKKRVGNLVSEYIRGTVGDLSEDELIMSAFWPNFALKASSWIKSLGPKSAAGIKVADWLEKQASFRNVKLRERALTNWVYASVLSGPSSAIVNLFQTPLITFSELGWGPGLLGVKESATRLKAFTGARLMNRIRGMSRRQATANAWKTSAPEFSAAGLDIDPRAFDIPDMAWGAVERRGIGGYVEGFNKALLSLFTGAERFNRLAAFYGARHKVNTELARGIYREHFPKFMTATTEGREMIRQWYGRQVVSDTQFIPHRLATSPVLGKLPPTLRQFSTFPVRSINYLVDSTIKGAMSDKELALAGGLQRAFGGRNWGPMARTTAASLGLFNFFRDVAGIDVSRATLPGFINVPPPNAPFYPLPIPPIPSLGIGLAKFMVTGDVDAIQPIKVPYVGQIPFPRVLVPGGLPLTRVARVINQFKGDVLYDDTGRAIMQHRPGDKYLVAMGLYPSMNARQRLQLQQLLRMRDNVRLYRRRLAHALTNFDTEAADGIRADYKKRYPMLPELAISRQDFRRYNRYQDMDRLTRALQTAGPAASALIR